MVDDATVGICLMKSDEADATITHLLDHSPDIRVEDHVTYFRVMTERDSPRGARVMRPGVEVRPELSVIEAEVATHQRALRIRGPELHRASAPAVVRRGHSPLGVHRGVLDLVLTRSRVGAGDTD